MPRWMRRLLDVGKHTCGYCGWGRRHRPHCPLTGRITSAYDEWA